MLNIKILNSNRNTLKADYIGVEASRTRRVAVATCSDMKTMLLDVMPDWVTSNEPEAIQFREDIEELVKLAEEASVNGTGLNKVISKTINRTDTGSDGFGISMPRYFSSRMFVCNISESTSMWLAVVAVVVLFAVFALSYM